MDGIMLKDSIGHTYYLVLDAITFLREQDGTLEIHVLGGETIFIKSDIFTFLNTIETKVTLN